MTDTHTHTQARQLSLQRWIWYEFSLSWSLKLNKLLESLRLRCPENANNVAKVTPLKVGLCETSSPSPINDYWPAMVILFQYWCLSSSEGSGAPQILPYLLYSVFCLLCKCLHHIVPSENSICGHEMQTTPLRNALQKNVPNEQPAITGDEDLKCICIFTVAMT